MATDQEGVAAAEGRRSSGRSARSGGRPRPGPCRRSVRNSAGCCPRRPRSRCGPSCSVPGCWRPMTSAGRDLGLVVQHNELRWSDLLDVLDGVGPVIDDLGHPLPGCAGARCGGLPGAAGTAEGAADLGGDRSGSGWGPRGGTADGWSADADRLSRPGGVRCRVCWWCSPAAGYWRERRRSGPGPRTRTRRCRSWRGPGSDRRRSGWDWRRGRMSILGWPGPGVAGCPVGCSTPGGCPRPGCSQLPAGLQRAAAASAARPAGVLADTSGRPGRAAMVRRASGVSADHGVRRAAVTGGSIAASTPPGGSGGRRRRAALPVAPAARATCAR